MNKHPSLEQQMIIAHVLGKSREFVIAHPELELNKRQQKTYEKMDKRLKNGEPLAYIIRQKEFYGLDFEVSKNTLIPRPETELLVEEALKLMTNRKKTKSLVVDIGTGSGCIIISLIKHKLSLCQKHELDLWEFLATDISPKALLAAKKNANKHGVEKRIKFIQSNLLDFLFGDKNKPIIKKNNDIIILANLPYLSEKIYNETEKSVKNFEPKSALFSGKDGLDHYKKLFRQINQLKQKNPAISWEIIFEISPEQKEIIEKEFPKIFNLHKLSFKKDLGEKWRIGFVLV